MKLLHEGKAKRVYIDDSSPDNVVIEFIDNVTAGDGAKHDVLEGKGKLACDLTAFFLKSLQKKGIETHLVKVLDDTRMRCKKVEILPVEVVCRNIAAGSFCRRYGIEKGTVLAEPLVEFFLKDDSLHDPLITSDAAVNLGLVTHSEIQFLRALTLSVNHYLSELFKQVNLVLVDFKLEFGKTTEGVILLADEISGDTIRVWDEKGESFDKDLYRDDEGDIRVAYSHLIELQQQMDIDAVPVREEVIHVIVQPKDGIKNPPGEVTRKALSRLGFTNLRDVRVGKVFEIHLSKPITSAVLDQLTLMNMKLLSNPVAEKHHVRLDL